MELDKLLKDSINEVDFEKIIKEQVKASIEKTIKSQVEDQFRSYSTIGKKIDEAIKESLNFDPKSTHILDYREFVIEQVNTALASYMSKEASDFVRKHINDNVIGETRDEIEFDIFCQELIDKIDNNFDWSDCSCDGPEPFKLEVVNKDYGWAKDWYSLKIYREKERTYSYSSSKNEKEILLEASISNNIYSINCNEFDFEYIEAWFKSLKFRKTEIKNVDDFEHSFGPEWDY